MKELKPCPFCGSDDVEAHYPTDSLIKCHKCGVMVDLGGDIIENWNTRPEAKTECPEYEYWFCHFCQCEIGPERVTNDEKCDTCGHPVEWITSEDLSSGAGTTQSGEVESVEEYKARVFPEINKSVQRVPIAFNSVSMSEEYGPVTYQSVIYAEQLNLILNTPPTPNKGE